MVRKAMNEEDSDAAPMPVVRPARPSPGAERNRGLGAIGRSTLQQLLQREAVRRQGIFQQVSRLLAGSPPLQRSPTIPTRLGSDPALARAGLSGSCERACRSAGHSSAGERRLNVSRRSTIVLPSALVSVAAAHALTLNLTVNDHGEVLAGRAEVADHLPDSVSRHVDRDLQEAWGTGSLGVGRRSPSGVLEQVAVRHPSGARRVCDSVG